MEKNNSLEEKTKETEFCENITGNESLDPLTKIMLTSPKEKSHPLSIIFKKHEFVPFGDELPLHSYLIFENPEKTSETLDEPLDLISPTSNIKTNIYSRLENGYLIFDMQTQQGQLRLSKLASPIGKTNPFPFLKLLASKMTLNQIGVIKVDYAHHKSDLAYKDDQGEKHTVEKSDVYYFVYIVEEEKSKANSLPGQNNTTVPLLANFD
jgi:hypothetical protein